MSKNSNHNILFTNYVQILYGVFNIMQHPLRIVIGN